MPSLRARFLALGPAALCLAVSACSNGDDPAADATPRTDATAAADAGFAADALSPVDAGVGDAGEVPDAAEVPDSGALADTGADPDASASPDAMDPPDGGFVTIVRLTATPTSARLVSVNGARPTARFDFELSWSDATTTATSGLAADVDPLLLGAWDPATGTFTANGRFGGPGQLTVHAGPAQTVISVRVELEQTIITPGTSTTVPDLFATPPITDPARAAQIVYPLDRAVMPQNVPPATIQWRNSAPGDAFRVRMRKPSVQVNAFTAYVVNSGSGFTDSWLADLDAWRRIAQSEPDELAEIIVDRWEAATGQVIEGQPIHVRFARAALLGSIYYWDIAAGRIIRINDGTANREAFLPSPQLGCIGCHSVSASGRYMAGRFGGGENVGGVFDLTQNLTAAPPPTVFPVTSTTSRWWFSSWSPDDSRLIVSVDEQGGGRALRVLDPFRGNFITPVSGQLPVGGVTHPAWSPDGTEIAYVADTNNWGGANSTGNIWMLPVLGQDSFGAPRRVMTATSVSNAFAGFAANYPSWSPDSASIAFAHGNSSRSESGQSALYFMHRDGGGLVRLDNASGGPAGNQSFQPRFSPFQQGGYFWLTFLSRRDYGNNRAGTAGTGRQQVWVAAIKESPAPGEDPSEVPYWLPGQNTASLNIAAFWAAYACREEQQACAVDAECCSGDCGTDGSGASVCVPSSGQCHPLGDPCTANEQCCRGILCVDGTCGVR